MRLVFHGGVFPSVVNCWKFPRTLNKTRYVVGSRCRHWEIFYLSLKWTKTCQYSTKCPFFLTVDSCWLKEWKVKEGSVFLHWWHLLPENIFSHRALIPGSDLRAVLLHPFIYFYALMETSVLVEATEGFSSVTSEHFVPTIFSGVNGALLVRCYWCFCRINEVCVHFFFFSGASRRFRHFSEFPCIAGRF